MIAAVRRAGPDGRRERVDRSLVDNAHSGILSEPSVIDAIHARGQLGPK
jgi:hypothetical protein